MCVHTCLLNAKEVVSRCGGPLLRSPMLWAHAQWHLDEASSNLTSGRLASLSRNLRTAWLVCSCRHLTSSTGAGFPPAVPSRGTCLLPRRSMLCLNLMHPWCLSVYRLCRCFLWVSARFPVTALWRIPLRGCGSGCAPLLVVQQWLFLR